MIPGLLQAAAAGPGRLRTKGPKKPTSGPHTSFLLYIITKAPRVGKSYVCVGAVASGRIIIQLSDIKPFSLFLPIEPTINLQASGEALVPGGDSTCGVPLRTRVSQPGSRLWLATGAPARGGGRV